MRIRTRGLSNGFLEVTVESGSAKLVEDITYISNGKNIVDQSDMWDFVEVALDCGRINGLNSVQFAEKFLERYLSKSEMHTVYQNLQKK